MINSRAASQTEILTIGHSTRDLGDFVGLLKSHEVTLLVDVRTIPRSKRNPQFNRETLPSSLSQVGIGYRHFPALGGLRRARADSHNLAWRNLSFRGFADYMQTEEFEVAIGELVDLARSCRLAIMCAEAVPWRCHRSLIADALTVRGLAVKHILSATNAKPHVLTEMARVRGTTVTYPAQV